MFLKNSRGKTNIKIKLMPLFFVILFMLGILIINNARSKEQATPHFYETFDSLASILLNNGVLSGGAGSENTTFEPGRSDMAVNFGCTLFSGSDCLREAYVEYPTAHNFHQGTIEFWIKPKSGFSNLHKGFFDLGKLWGTHPYSMGIFWNRSNKNVIFEMYEGGGTTRRQAWSAQDLDDTDAKWHHVAAVWQCNTNTGTDYMQVFLDGQPGTKYTYGDGNCTYLPVYTDFWAGKNFFYGSSFSLMDEFKIFDYPKTAEEIADENRPQFLSITPQDYDVIKNIGETVNFYVNAFDPNGDPITYEWYLNDTLVSTTDSYDYPLTGQGEDVMYLKVSDGTFERTRIWSISVPDPSEQYPVTVWQDKIYINGQEFLVKGIDYAPWIKNTGPEPSHNSFPDEFDDVTSLMTDPDIDIYVTDYSEDGFIQAWEVINYDMETMKNAGANTVRTYGSGSWHDRNLNGIIDRSPDPKIDEIVQGDLPDWVYNRMIAYAESNDMKILIGYWVQEEDNFDEDPVTPGYQLECDWDDLEVAKDTLTRVINNFSSSPAVLGWAIGNEVHGSWNQGWFDWTVDINTYLNLLYAHVKSVDDYNKPIMYAHYIGEDVHFNNLMANIIGPQAYIFPASEIGFEFLPAAPDQRAYLLAEFGHRIEQLEGHWNLAQSHAGGAFIEYNDVWWKYIWGEGQDDLGIVDMYRKIKPERFWPLFLTYVPKASCISCVACNLELASGPTNLEISEDILNQIGSCLEVGANYTILDCNNQIISGDGTGDDYGLKVDSHKTVLIRNCEISDFNKGIYFDRALRNYVENNILSNNNYGLFLDNLSYLNDLNGNTLLNNGSGIYLADSEKNQVIGNTINSNGTGINLSSSADDNIIDNNTLSGNDTGISLSSNWSNEIMNNNIFNNVNAGLSLLSNAQGHFIHENTFQNNLYGAVVNTSNMNNFAVNTFLQNNYGLKIESTSQSSISYNDFTDNTEYGILLMNSSNNDVWLNNFSGNQVSAYEDFNSISNDWDKFSSGNYWSDFEDNQLCPYKYEIPGPGNGVDNYPTSPDCVDVDGDGYGLVCAYNCPSVGIDCNDNNANINPGQAEVCQNNIDDDCDGFTDEGCKRTKYKFKVF